MKRDYSTVVIVILGSVFASTLLAEVTAKNLTIQGRTAVLSFQVEAPGAPMKVMEALFDPKNMALLSQADRIEMISGDPSHQVVRYTFKTMFLENQSLYERTLQLAEGRVQFVMMKNLRMSPALPEQLASRGFYLVTQQGKGCSVEYHQETTFGRDLFFYERHFLERSAREQVAKMKAFILSIR